LSTSLRAGLAAVPNTADGVIVCLGDMPLVGGLEIDKLISAFNHNEHRTIIVPVHGGERGNPVLWGRQHFADMAKLEGDRGARQLIDANADQVTEVAMRSDTVLADFDTPESLSRFKSVSGS